EEEEEAAGEGDQGGSLVESPNGPSTAEVEPGKVVTQLDLSASGHATSAGSAELSISRVMEGRPVYRTGVLRVMSTGRDKTWRLSDVLGEMNNLGWIAAG